jgi:putative hemolysin
MSTRPVSQTLRPPVPRPSLCADVASLPRDQILLERGELQIGLARAGQIPSLLQEIGRLRELTFRAAGEGTGHAIDLDRYDATYWHLFAWNHQRQELVGAYRLAGTDRVLERQGISGLYTSSLFEYDASFLERLGPALELGRSFVRPEYQRSSLALMALWKGIGCIVAAQPRYCVLFGPVSIPARYSAMSRGLISAVLSRFHAHPELVEAVRPRRPFEGPTPEVERELADPEALARAVSEIEHDGKALPVLVREYLKLGGRFLAFNVDRDFSDVLDGLVAVDLLRTDQRHLAFYMGSAAAASFLTHHGIALRKRAT